MIPVRAMLRDERGFTLTELLVVTAVLGLILAGVVLVQQRGQEAYLFGAHRVEVQQNNRSALELMVRELRSAKSVTAIPSATNLTFQDADGVTKQYQLSGTTLNRTVAGTTTPLIGGVQTLSMTYFSAWNGATNTGTSTTAPSSVKLIRIQLVTGTEDQVGAASPGNQRAIMESLVQLRNIP
jgi:prepilin-type N-terminal cleavage/methylation domain-containing protein